MPNIASAVIRKLKPGDRFNVDAVSPDALWYRVEIAPVVTGWVSTPVLARMSRDAGPGAATRPVPLQQIMLLITGILQPPYNDELVDLPVGVGALFDLEGLARRGASLRARLARRTI
jgi:hypothetical protein